MPRIYEGGVKVGKLIVFICIIRFMDFRKLDLNLLVLLDVLLSEGSVTRAAKRVHLSQPAMSAALKRLRCAFQDPLLIRTSAGMEPTVKAKEISGPIRAVLAQIQDAVLSRPELDIRLVETPFSIATSEYVSFVVMQRLVRELRKRAPRIPLIVSRIDIADPFEPLNSGMVDLIIGAHLGVSPSIHRSDLFWDTIVCIARKNHPAVKGKLTIEQFIEAPQLVIHGQAGGRKDVVDNMFQQMGKSRKVAISLPDFLAAPYIIMETDLIMSMPHRMAISLEKRYPIQVLRQPIPREPFNVSLFWHQRAESDRVHQWVRDLIKEVSSSLSDLADRNNPNDRNDTLMSLS